MWDGKKGEEALLERLRGWLREKEADDIELVKVELGMRWEIQDHSQGITAVEQYVVLGRNGTGSLVRDVMVVLSEWDEEPGYGKQRTYELEPKKKNVETVQACLETAARLWATDEISLPSMADYKMGERFGKVLQNWRPVEQDAGWEDYTVAEIVGYGQIAARRRHEMMIVAVPTLAEML